MAGRTLEHPGCQQVFILGARGSGENKPTPNYFDGWGRETNSIKQEFTGRMDSARLKWKSMSLSYPAADTKVLRPSDAELKHFLSGTPGQQALAIASYKEKRLGPYLDSMQSGVATVEAILESEASKCPNERFVLVGYSQGAIVMHRALNKLAKQSRGDILDHVSGLGLIADGDRVKGSTVRNLGTDAANGKGIATALLPPGKDVPARLLRRTVTLCDRDDIVCDFQLTKIGDYRRTTRIHTSYDPGRLTRVGTLLARWAASDLPQGASSRRLSLTPTGTEPTGDSMPGDVSDDGTRAVFISDAPEYGGVPGQQWVVVLSDATSGLLLEPLSTSSAQLAPAISGDGSTVAYDASGNATGRLTIRSLDTGKVTALRTPPGPDGVFIDANDADSRLALSADGRYLLFTTRSPINGYSEPNEQAWRYDSVTGDYELVSFNDEGNPSIGATRSYGISGDGQTVAFVTNATDIGGGSGGGGGSGFRWVVRNLVTGEIREIATADRAMQPRGLSDNMRYVSWYSQGPDGGSPTVSVSDELTGTTVQRSLPVAPIASSCGSVYIQTLAADSGDRVLVARSCGWGELDSTLFLFDLETNTATVLRGAEDDPFWGWVRASPDLAHVTFAQEDATTSASPSGLPDANGFVDVFQWDSGQP